MSFSEIAPPLLRQWSEQPKLLPLSFQMRAHQMSELLSLTFQPEQSTSNSTLYNSADSVLTE